MAVERMDKLLGGLGFGSRREIAALARRGKITVNGQLCREPACKIDPCRDKLMVDSEEVVYRAHWYLMLNKPAGVITATEDKRQTTVISLLPERMQHVGLFPVGRLDKDTQGLLLLTTDGTFDHALMSPKKHVSKLYEAQVNGEPVQGAEMLFREGLVLADGLQCRPAELKRIRSGCVQVTLCEGKFHQVKRMLAAVGSEVTALRRLAIGTLTLDPSLELGAFRELDDNEIRGLVADKAHFYASKQEK